MISPIIQRITSLLPFLILTILFNQLHAQKTDRLRHLSGTRTINGIQVTVTQEGAVDSLTYCGDDTGPYFVGNDYSGLGNITGSYIFTFTQPVKEVFLNIAALSVSDTYSEEVQIYVNGSHYFVTDIGHDSGCEPMPIISAEGNIRPCNSCTGSGADKIKIKGPITTLKVTCKILKGEPQGMVMGVYMGEKAKDEITNTLVNYTATIGENAAGKELLIESNQLENAVITLKNSNGYIIALHYRIIEANRIIIDASDLVKGEYFLEINLNDEIEKQRLLIN